MRLFNIICIYIIVAVFQAAATVASADAGLFSSGKKEEKNIYKTRYQEQQRFSAQLAKDLKATKRQNQTLQAKISALEKEVDYLSQKGQSLTEKVCNLNTAMQAYEPPSQSAFYSDERLKEKIYANSDKLEDLALQLASSNAENKRYRRVVDKFVDATRRVLMEDQKEKRFLRERIADYTETVKGLEENIRALKEEAGSIHTEDEYLNIDTLSKVPSTKDVVNQLHIKSEEALTKGYLSHEEQQRLNINKQLALMHSLNGRVVELKSLYAAKLIEVELEVNRLKKRLMDIESVEVPAEVSAAPVAAATN